jgi:pantetheine-phosphate adenylyltransferase
MSNIALFPGTFDPFTIGHESIVYRSLHLFDKVVIGVGHNDNKKTYFSWKVRLEMIQDVFKDHPEIEVTHYSDLTIDLCRRIGARFILRGLRTSADFEYERAIAQVNKAMLPEIETVFILTLPEHTAINSSIVREILRYGGDASKFMPASFNPQKHLKQ